MLAISALVDVARTVDEDGFSSFPSRLARAWGEERARFVRSSANHVFLCGEALVLRVHPDEPGVADRMRRVGELSGRLAAAGAPVAAAVPGLDGELVAVDPETNTVAQALTAVPGDRVDDATLTRGSARYWGSALAHLHAAGARFTDERELPAWPDRVADAAAAVGDREVRSTGLSIASELGRLPSDGAVFGIVHGDPELDNVVWPRPAEPCFVDLDDAARSWFAADVAFALRDFAAPAGAPSLRTEPASSFVAGYRDIRPLSGEELTRLPLFARAHAVVTLAGLERTLAEAPQESWPPWAHALRHRVERVAEALRDALRRHGGRRA